MNISVQAEPSTTKIPPMIQTPKPHVSSLPARVSTAENGRSHWTTSRSPAAVKTIRSESPAARASGTAPTTTSETPSMKDAASADERPASARRIPARTASVPGIHRSFRERRATGSGVFRIAATMFRRLTLTADSVTITNVSSTPTPKPTTRLSGWTSPDLHAREVERRRQDEHHAERDGDAENHAHHGGEEVVDEPLEQVELHQVAAPRADGAGDPELAPPLGGEHHEDQEDQQAAGEDREAAEGREDRHESVAFRVGGFERVALDRIDLEPPRRHDGIDDRRDLVGQLGAGELVAPVRDQHVLDLSDPVEEPLGRVERQEQGGAVGARAFVVDDLATLTGNASPSA